MTKADLSKAQRKVLYLMNTGVRLHQPPTRAAFMRPNGDDHLTVMRPTLWHLSQASLILKVEHGDFYVILPKGVAIAATIQPTDFE